MRPQPKRTGAAANDLRQEVAEGLFYTHTRLSQNTNKTLVTPAFLYGLIELLSEKGPISIQELDERRKRRRGCRKLKYASVRRR